MLTSNKRLKNQGIWRSTEKWKFKPKDDSHLIYIENISKNKVLEVSSDGDVILKDLEEGKAEQLWYQETSYASNAKGYFMLRNSHDDGVLNPTLFANGTSNKLVVRGNISLS